jgi:hypothetical protein
LLKAREWGSTGSYPQRIAGVYNVGGGARFGVSLTIDAAAAIFGSRSS